MWDKAMTLVPIMLSINAMLLVAGVLPADAGQTVMSFMPTGISVAGVDTNANMNIYNPQSASTISTSIDLIPQNSNAYDVFAAVSTLYNSFIYLLFGWGIAIALMLPPDLLPIAYPFLVVVGFISIAGLAYFILNIVNAIRGNF